MANLISALDMNKPYPENLVNFFSDHKNAAKSAIHTEKEVRKKNLSSKKKKVSFAWILSESGLPWLKLDLKIPYKEMLNEAQRLREYFIPHRSNPDGIVPDGNTYDAKGWKALCLHAISSKHSGGYNEYGYKSEEETPYKWTEMADLCPVTTSFFKNDYPCEKYYRVRFMLIEPGGYIMPHIDRKKSLLWEVNFALNNPKECFFKMEGQGYIPYKPHSAFVLDVSHTHAVANFSNEDRYHLIVHGNPIQDERYREMIVRSYQKFLRR